jgi:hypothetical protein
MDPRDAIADIKLIMSKMSKGRASTLDMTILNRRMSFIKAQPNSTYLMKSIVA